MDQRLEMNKQTAMAFYDLAFNQNKPREAVERYVGAEYVQHNPGVADGKDAFIADSEPILVRVFTTACPAAFHIGTV